MTQAGAGKWNGLLVSDVIKSHPGAVHLFDNYKQLHSTETPLTVEQFCVKYEVPVDELAQVLNEMESVSYSSAVGASEWTLDFLVDFLVNIHHAYIRKIVPVLLQKTEELSQTEKSEVLTALHMLLKRLRFDLIKKLGFTEDVLFPYIKQITRTAKEHESYGGLLVTTLRKPIEQHLNVEILLMEEVIGEVRLQTNYYCMDNISGKFRMILVLLKHFDFQLQKHIELKRDVLIPRSLEVEQSLH